MAKENCRFKHEGLWCMEPLTHPDGRQLYCHREPCHEGQHHAFARVGPCFTWNTE